MRRPPSEPTRVLHVEDRGPELDRRFEALVVDADFLGPAAEGSAALGPLLADACRLGLHVAIVTDDDVRRLTDRLTAQAVGAGTLLALGGPGSCVLRLGSGGPRRVARTTDPMAWVFRWLWRQGIGPGVALVMRAAAGSLPPAPPRAAVLAVDDDAGALARVLADQIARRRRREPPAVDDDPAWTIRGRAEHVEDTRADASRLALGDGLIGTRGSAVGIVGVDDDPGVVAAGVYENHGAESRLLAAPVWHRVATVPAGGRACRWLDLHAGLRAEQVGRDGEVLDAVLFCSLARPGTGFLRARTAARSLDWSPPLAAPADPGPDTIVTAAAVGQPGGVAAAACQWSSVGIDGLWLERIAAYRVDPDRAPATAAAVDRLRPARSGGFERELNRHRARWGQRWEDAGVDIAGAPELERAVRFALFHLIGSVAERGEAAVGARGLTGPAYRGHVFWDTDVYVLPFFAATHPAAARAMLQYRIRRLPAARAEAGTTGGAHFPWESAASGEEVTPTRGRDRLGRFVAIRTGQLEEHIVADVAWAADCYAQWTGDDAYVRGPARPLITETARWWATRIERDGARRGHIRGVIGPDEYHQPVDDNAFTNVMARWNLRRAAELLARAGDADTARQWRVLADSLVDGYDPATGIYEQFAGFHQLEPLIIAEIAATRPVAASLLLGDERVAAAQVVKQADVLMLHHLLPDDVAPGSLRPNLDFYEPRTAHGSSLSPGVHSTLLARAGEIDRALELLHVAANIDLDDITETTAGGLHLAAMGSTWQALVVGFAGVRPHGATLAIAPARPFPWRRLTLRLRFRGARLRIVIAPREVTVHTDRPVTVRVDRAPATTVRRPCGRFPLEGVAVTVLAAIDHSAATGPVLTTACAMGRLLATAVTAIHVREDGIAEVSAAAARAAVGLVIAPGPVAEALLEAGRADDVTAMVVGARAAAGGAEPAGHIALQLLTALNKPVVVVSPAADVASRIDRILVPLEGTRESAGALQEVLDAARRRGTEVILLHVHDPRALPAFEEQPHHELEAWSREFVARWSTAGPPRPALEVRVGAAGEQVVEAAAQLGIGLVALGWSRRLDAGRAQVVREALRSSPVPILLMPTPGP